MLVRVTAVGLCGSDRHWFVEGGIGDAVLTGPLVLGHEFVGVVETGPQIGRTGRGRSGDHMRKLRDVRRRAAQPLRRDQVRRPLDGRRAAVADRLARAPPAIRFRTRSRTPTRRCSNRSEWRCTRSISGAFDPGTSAAVLGCGPIGLLIVRLLRAVGATPIVGPRSAATPRRSRRGGGRSPDTTRGCRRRLRRHRRRHGRRGGPGRPVPAVESSSSGSRAATGRLSPRPRPGARAFRSCSAAECSQSISGEPFASSRAASSVWTRS